MSTTTTRTKELAIANAAGNIRDGIAKLYATGLRPDTVTKLVEGAYDAATFGAMLDDMRRVS